MSNTKIKTALDAESKDILVSLRISHNDLISVEMDKQTRDYHQLLEKGGKMSDLIFYYADLVSLMEAHAKD